MKKADSLTTRVTSQLTTSGGNGETKKRAASAEQGPDHVDAINQVFAELELAYHNQYHKAYSQDGSVGIAKKYWLGCLAPFSPELIIKAVRRVVKSQQFLPSVAGIVQACEEALSEYGMPAAHDAYVQACCAPHPKAAFNWSHPVVYFAGKATGWFELENTPEAKIFPLFESHYRKLCQRVLAGEEFVVEVPASLPSDGKQLSPEENKSRMAALRKSLKK